MAPEDAYAQMQQARQDVLASWLIIDPDGDGLGNLREFQLGTHPHIADTDGDGTSDLSEVQNGSNPTAADSVSSGTSGSGGSSTGSGTGSSNTSGTSGSSTGSSPPATAPVQTSGLALFTAWRYKEMNYQGGQEAEYHTMMVGDGSGQTEEGGWFKHSDEPPPPLGNDNFNGDADEGGDVVDPGDPRDLLPPTIPDSLIPAQEGEEGAFYVQTTSSSGGGTLEIIGPPYPSPIINDTYIGKNSYTPPDEVKDNGAFSVGKAYEVLARVPYHKGAESNGWMGNGYLGLKSYQVSSLLRSWEEQYPYTYTDEDGQEYSDSITLARNTAHLAAGQLRLQCNRARSAEEEPLRASFLLLRETRSLISSEAPQSECVATIELRIVTGTTSTQHSVTSGTLPAEDASLENGVLTLRSPTPIEGKSVQYNLLPIEVVELSPKLRDADNNEIAGSEVPKNLPESNSMVEEAPNTNRIAHREMKVKVGSALKDKKITWTMDAKFTPEGQSQPSFRGDWARAATTHRDRFETSTAYGAHAYRRISQEQAETTVDADGFTAIRVNVPPIGFNKARIKIQIEGTTTPVELIDLDVQAVVVIDPGHGGTPDTDFQSASWNNSTSPSGVLEKTMALSYGQELKTSLETHIQAQRLNIKVLITRTTDVSVSGRDRAYLARDNGADQLFIIHFNASDAHTARGTLEVRQDPNLAGSLPEDIEFIDAVLDRMVPAMQPFDAACNRRAHVVKDTTVATDTYMGNEANYHPVRAGYCEVEFIDFGAQTPNDQTDDAVDILLNTGPNAGAIKTAIANAMRDGIIQDLRTQPRPTP